jgi:N-carbamoylputrescine amidase
VQTRPVIGDIASNLSAIESAVREAVQRGAELVVLPELCITGYVFRDRAEAVSLAEPVSGPSVTALSRLAAQLGVHLVAGIAEQDATELYNTAVLIGPAGMLGRYRKLHLWDNENTIFRPGNLGLPVFETSLGRLGLLICYDLWFPEATRALALQGADMICVPTNWVPIPGQRSGAAAMATTLCQAAAHVNGVYVLAADRVGEERGQPFVGQSTIIAPTGWPVVEIASSDEPAVLVTQIDPRAGAGSRRWNAHNNPLADRRPAVYSAALTDDDALAQQPGERG